MPRRSIFADLSAKVRKNERNTKENLFFFAFPNAGIFGKAKGTKKSKKVEK
jgi:hypothetical protein